MVCRVGGVRIDLLIAAELSTFGAQVIIGGPPVTIGGPFAQNMALITHELSATAAKYGALSRPEGRVQVTWSVERSASEEEKFKFKWLESGGPLVPPPAERGFGLKMILFLLRGAGRVSFEAPGFKFEFEVPVSEITKDSASW